ncbi:DUF456 domain-containing protein [Nocardia sp. CDC159]|uniref:DUF456 domain-containing protein n=1 Tax=Nocardia pulmonis TaxID=2951408 RepID=A0A9X2E736_9NOCA|nr:MULTISPECIES: DUF456 domain-containing protein [Nocardia]MCM6775454.1 DUF456 domain-containing protein [Nocardia pulmonis]MCM6787812.1 DUF456 domain-containing protein [Nocardia sp. CDC159]
MRFSKFAATALIATAATGITAATATAAPGVAEPGTDQVQAQAAPAVHGADQGVGYTTRIDDAGKSIVTTVTGGRFALDTGANAVTLINDAGQVVMNYPLTVQNAGKTAEIAAAVDADGSRLTLTPKGEAVASVKDISAQQWFFDELQRASLGAAVGAVIGGLIGLFFIGIGAIPGALLGAVIGLLVAGGPSLLAAGQAYFSGQP